MSAMRFHETTAADRDAAERPVVLIVEDDPDIRSLIAEMLEDVACVVLSATSGEAALGLLERHAVRLAIVDQTLPGIPGSAFVTRARARQPALRAIYVSGAPIEATAYDAPPDPVLLKPFGSSELRSAVTTLLQRRTAE